MVDPEQELVKYLTDTLKDRKASQYRKDKAAAMLTKVLGKKKRGSVKEGPRENNPYYRSKKAERQEAASETAQGDDWADLIPKAQVVPLRRS